MLLRLVIQNLALIEHAELEPASGLSVFTGRDRCGQDHAGPGDRPGGGGQPRSAPVGPHAEEAYVEAEFALPEGPAWTTRRWRRWPVFGRRASTPWWWRGGCSRSGRTRALVWGRSCARTDLELLGERLLELSSQHEAQRLAEPAYQLALLDGHAANGERLGAMATAWSELRAARVTLADAREHAAEPSAAAASSNIWSSGWTRPRWLPANAH